MRLFNVIHPIRGFSLVEVVLFVIIVGIGVAGIVTPFVTSVTHSHEPLLRQKAVALANFYMDEILRKKWNEATPNGGGCVNTGSGICTTAPTAIAIGVDSGESRATYDDIDDYHGIDNAPPKDQQGNDLADFSGYRVAVSVTEIGWDPIGDANHDIPAADNRRIQINVTSPLNETMTLVAYRSNY